MKAEQKELYNFTKDHFEDELERISPACVSPIIATRQVVKKAIYRYVNDYCSTGTKAEDIFSQDDFQEVSKRICSEI